MSIYLISDIIKDIGEDFELPSQVEGGGPYSITSVTSLEDYPSLTLYKDDTVIYDLRLALNKGGFIDNDKVWNDISSNSSWLTSEPNVTLNLIIYAFSELEDESWKDMSWKDDVSWENIILKRNKFPEFPKFTILIFDGLDEDSIQVYWKAISVEITGWEDLHILALDYLNYIHKLDISGNNLFKVDFDGLFEGNIRSITMRNMIIDGNNTGDGEININQSTLEYLDITNTVCNKLALSVANLKQLIGFTHKTLKTIKIDVTDIPPSLSLSSFKLPINLTNFPSNISIVLYYIDYFPTGLDTIEKIGTLDIDNCKNINAVRDLYINDCYSIYFRCIYKLNKIEINNISKYTVNGGNKNWITMITNIDLVTLKLPKQDFSEIAVTLYANINLSEIICNGISYGKEDSEYDLVDLCKLLKMELFEYNNDDNITNNISNLINNKHKLGFNRLYIKEEFDHYNINPQIYKNSKLLGNPLTGNSIADILKYKDIEYSYIELPKLDTIINNADLMEMLVNNVINYNDNNVVFTFEWYYNFVALGLTTDTATSFVNVIDSHDDEGIIFTNSPGLFKEVKNGKVINLFTYAPDLPNVFGIKLVVY